MEVQVEVIRSDLEVIKRYLRRIADTLGEFFDSEVSGQGLNDSIGSSKGYVL